MDDNHLRLVNNIGPIKPLTEHQKRRAAIWAAGYCEEQGTVDLLPQFLSQLGLDE